MNCGLSPSVVARIQNVFAKYPQIMQVILYGSRAKGNFRPNSDIDLTMKGEGLNLTEQLRIENELDDLLLPYKIDLSVYHHIQNADLIDHIDRVGAVFYNK